jgi:ADP-ribose pyrophosphatase
VNQPKPVLTTPWFRVEIVPAGAAASDPEAPYYQIAQGDGVIVMTVAADGRLVFVRQFRPPLGRAALETPAGFIDDNENPEDAAHREVYEETGYRCDKIIHLGRGRLLMNRVTSRDHMMLATGARKDPQFTPRENIEIVELEPAEFRRMILDGTFEQMAAFALLFMIEQKMGWRLI